MEHHKVSLDEHLSLLFGVLQTVLLFILNRSHVEDLFVFSPKNHKVFAQGHYCFLWLSVLFVKVLSDEGGSPHSYILHKFFPAR